MCVERCECSILLPPIQFVQLNCKCHCSSHRHCRHCSSSFACSFNVWLENLAVEKILKNQFVANNFQSPLPLPSPSPEAWRIQSNVQLSNVQKLASERTNARNERRKEGTNKTCIETTIKCTQSLLLLASPKKIGPANKKKWRKNEIIKIGRNRFAWEGKTFPRNFPRNLTRVLGARLPDN